MGLALAAVVGSFLTAAAAANAGGSADLIDYTNTVGPAFIAALATLVTAIALLIRARTAAKLATAKLDATRAAAETAAAKATEAADQVNGKMARKDAEIAQLREQLDNLHTELSHSRRTNEALIERGTR